VTMAYEDVLIMLEALHEKIERVSVEQKVVGPKREREVDELLREHREAIEAVKELMRRQRDEERLAALFGAIDENTARFLEAITENTTTTNDLLAELVSKNGAPPFGAPKPVLEEGERLRARLGVGGFGTQAPPERQPVPAVPTGLEVLAATLAKPKASRKS
jgi:hypothetical protein